MMFFLVEWLLITFILKYFCMLMTSSSQLRDMINALFNYCQMWSLKANMDKSKILVFRNGPISHNLKWNFCEDNIDIINSYKYLGIELTYNLSFRKLLKNKLVTAKEAIASTWSKYINNPKI